MAGQRSADAEQRPALRFLRCSGCDRLRAVSHLRTRTRFLFQTWRRRAKIVGPGRQARRSCGSLGYIGASRVKRDDGVEVGTSGSARHRWSGRSVGQSPTYACPRVKRGDAAERVRARGSCEGRTSDRAWLSARGDAARPGTAIAWTIRTDRRSVGSEG